jgi:tripartite-type tricarboxylate transporter receptor subunit TctC
MQSMSLFPAIPGPAFRALRALGGRLAFLATASVFSLGVHAEPTETIKLIVPYPAGGVTDQAARVLAERMSQALGQTLIVDNRPGAGSRIGAMAVAQGPADGSMLLFTNISFSTLPLADRTVKYDPIKSFAPIGLVAVYGAAIVIRPALPASNLAELVAYARKNPGKLSYGSAGLGSGAHFVGEYFKSLTGTFIVHVPYRTTAAALNDVAGGQVDIAVDATAKPLVDAGKVKALAIVGAQRDPRMPDVPTAAEAGLKGLDFNAWVGVLAPPGTPPALVDKFNKAMNTALQDPALRRRYQDMGLLPAGGAPDRLTGQLREDATVYRKVIERAGLKFD